MRRYLCVILLLACTASPALAQGGGREWLEKMSGPELQGWEFRLPLFCVWTNKETSQVVWQFDVRTLARALENNRRRQLCVDIAYAAFNNVDRNEVDQLVNAQRWEGSLAYRFDWLADTAATEWLTTFEPGVAIGSMVFLTDQGREGRLQISPRLVIKPFKLLGTIRRERWSGILAVSFRWQWMARGVTNEDIGAFAYEPFEDQWLRGGTYIAIDLSELIR